MLHRQRKTRQRETKGKEQQLTEIIKKTRGTDKRIIGNRGTITQDIDIKMSVRPIRYLKERIQDVPMQGEGKYKRVSHSQEYSDDKGQEGKVGKKNWLCSKNKDIQKLSILMEK